MIRRLLSSIILILPFFAWGETLRARPAGTVVPGGDPVEFAIDDMVDIALPQPSPLNSYAVLILEIPREALRYRQLIGVSLYTNLRPRYRTGFRDYIANRLRTEVLPVTQRYEIRIPLHQGIRLTAARDTWNLNGPLNTAEGNPALVLMALEKEIPDGLIDLRFKLSCRIEPGTQAALKIELPELTPVEKEKVRISVDGKEQPWADIIYVQQGVRVIGITGSPLAYAPATLSFTAGTTNDLVLVPQETDSYLVWDLPQSARVILNNIPLSAPLPAQTLVEPGTWRIVVNVGGASLTKVLEITRPGRFTVSLDMELLVDGD